MEQQETILIADDQEMNLSLLEFILQKEYRVLKARNGKQAFETILNQHVDLLLLDLVMPLMDGFEVLRRLKVWRRDRTLPVILVTSEASEKNVQVGMEYGVCDVIAKPFDPQDILNRVHRVLREAAAGRPAAAQEPPPAHFFQEPKHKRLLLAGVQEKDRALLIGPLADAYELDEANSLATCEEAVVLHKNVLSGIVLDYLMLELNAGQILHLLERTFPEQAPPLLLLLSEASQYEGLAAFRYDLYDVADRPLRPEIAVKRMAHLAELYWLRRRFAAER